MHNPEKNSPQKITLEKLRQGLSQKQETRIAYECDLLRTTPEKLFYIAGYLFQENVTAANTIVKEDIKKEPEIPNDDDYSDSNYPIYDDYM